MSNNSVFRYNYAAQPNEEVQAIRSKYVAQPESKLDALKALDRKVRRPAAVLAYVVGSISAIVMGAGMSLVMTDIGSMLGMTETMVHGIVIGVVGLVLAVANYPVYKGVLNARRKKYADQIIAFSDELMEE